jgi:hypothetical protein
MSNEQIRIFLFEKTVTPINIYLELSSFKSFTFYLIDDIRKNSKSNYKVINFDPIYYRHCILNNDNKISYNTEFSKKIFENLTNNVIIIGIELLSDYNLNEFFKEFSQLNLNNVIFAISSSINKSHNIQLIQNFCSLLLIENIYRKKDNFLYSKIEVNNMFKLNRDYVVFQYEIKDNKISKFNGIKLYSGEMKTIFDEVQKVIEHETTFNVNLTENERKEKNEVALPYIKSNEEKRNDLIEVDQADIDELYDEDPDDDLDI